MRAGCSDRGKSSPCEESDLNQKPPQHALAFPLIQIPQDYSQFRDKKHKEEEAREEEADDILVGSRVSCQFKIKKGKIQKFTLLKNCSSFCKVVYFIRSCPPEAILKLLMNLMLKFGSLLVTI